jgi:ABC-2 type transport system ATP-binding protein
MLELQNVCKRYSGIPAVEGVSFRARPGEVTGYLGANGSGKSTTIKMITSLIDTDSGRILFDGKPIHHDLATYKRRLGYVPEEPHLYTHLTGLEYLEMVGELRDLPTKITASQIDGLLHLLALHGDRDLQISSYSKGMKQKLLVAAALLHNPDLIVLDEPFSGLDAGSMQTLRNLIQELAKRGKVILFSSHDLETIQSICSHVVLLHQGQVVADDSVKHLQNRTSLEEIFSQLAAQPDAAPTSRQIIDLIHA